jgi:hypothetical protein
LEDSIMNDIAAFPPSGLPEMEIFTGFVSFSGCRIQVDFAVPVGASGQQLDSAFVQALLQEEGVDIEYLSLGATRLEEGTEVRLESSSQLCAPGLFRYLQNAYQTGDALVAIQALTATYDYLDQVLAEALLSGRVPVHIEEDEKVCFEVPPADVLAEVRRNSKRAWSLSDAVLASRYFVRCVLADGSKVLVPTTARRVTKAFALHMQEHQALPEFFYCDEAGKLHPIVAGQPHSAEPEAAGEGTVVPVWFDLLANGEVIGQIPRSVH